MSEPAAPRLVLGDHGVDVPLAEVAPERRAELEPVRAAPTVRRPLVVRAVAAPVAVYERLLDELPLAAAVVRRLGAGAYTIASRGEGVFDIDDGHGAHARVERLVQRPGVRVYLARGEMDVPMLPVVRGLGLITLRYEASGAGTATGGQIYFRLGSRILHALVKAVVPLIHGAIDAKVHKLTEAALEACRHVAVDGADAEVARSSSCSDSSPTNR